MKKKEHANTINIVLALAGVVVALIIMESLTHTLLGWLLLIVMSSLAASVVFLLKIYPAWRKSEAYRALQLADVDNMSGEQFERYVNELLKAQGYKTEMTPARNDYGVDIVAERDGVRHAVQCKRYGENISRGAVSDAVAGKHYYNCSQAVVVTNRYFRSGARELASASQCLLIDREVLTGWIQSFQTAQTEAQPASAKARSLAIRVAVGSSACILLLGAMYSAFSTRQTPAPTSTGKRTPSPADTVTVKAASKPKLSAERKFQQGKLIADLISLGATREQIAEARTRLDAMPDAEFRTLMESRKIIEEETRRIEQGLDESQKPPERRRSKEGVETQ